jgi:hypothetical protein
LGEDSTPEAEVEQPESSPGIEPSANGDGSVIDLDALADKVVERLVKVLAEALQG